MVMQNEPASDRTSARAAAGRFQVPEFRSAHGDRSGVVYVQTSDGRLFFYKDQRRGGGVGWANNGNPKTIGTEDWNFSNFVNAGDGVIYGARSDGKLFYYKDLSRNGSVNWANGGKGSQISGGWSNVMHMISGGDGRLYSVDRNGDLYFNQDMARNGNQNMRFSGKGNQIGEGWDIFRFVLAGGNGVIYGITPDGTMFRYRDLAQNGSRHWAEDGQVGSDWMAYSYVFSGEGGVIYGADAEGVLFRYLPDGNSWRIREMVGTEWRLRHHLQFVEGFAYPPSAAEGESVQLFTSCGYTHEVDWVRLGDPNDGGDNPLSARGIPVDTLSVTLPPGVQHLDNLAWRDGCEWKKTASWKIPMGSRAGLYAARCRSNTGQLTYSTFVVRPAVRRAKMAVLSNIITWTAYNSWGGRSKYTSGQLGTGALLSLKRPNGMSDPRWQLARNHTAHAETWLFRWLNKNRIAHDAYADLDLDSGILTLNDYDIVVIHTHSEYWTIEMKHRLEEYINNGGRVVVLGGNTMFEKVEVGADRSNIVVLGGDEHADRRYFYFRNLVPPEPERNILGVAYLANDIDTNAAFEVKDMSHRLFKPIKVQNGQTFGATGYNGAASGWERDSAVPGTAGPGELVSATTGDDRGKSPDNTEILAKGRNKDCPADISFFKTPSGGFVFCAGAINVVGSVVAGDPILERLLLNVLDPSND